MYVSVDDPIPQNGMMAPPAACVDASNAVIEMARRVSQYGRLAAFGSAPTLEGIAAISPGAAASAAIMLPQSSLARTSLVSGAVPLPAASTLTVRPAARRLTVIPLNWIPDAEGEVSCAPVRSASAAPPPALPAVVMPALLPPPPAPAPPAPPAMTVQPRSSAPVYSNLCWALRNGMVDSDQFDPAELQALQLLCSQLGYAGACPPPSAVQMWKQQQRAAGTLPHISVSQTDLSAIPPAPPLTGVSCVDSWRMGGVPAGMSGLAGFAVPWGDAPVMGGGADAGGVRGFVQRNPWLFPLGIGLAAVAVLGSRNARGGR